MSHRPNLIQRLKRLFGGAKLAPETAVSVADPAIVPDLPNAIPTREAKYQLGQIVRHRLFDFRGVVFDVDPVFANTDEWYEAIPEEVRPGKDQPYYHLFAENERTHYVAYVSEQNLVADDDNARISHPDIAKVFELTDGGYVLKSGQRN
jgi:heat shock protein HspQ